MRMDREVGELGWGREAYLFVPRVANSLDHDYYGETEKIKRISGNQN